MTELTLAPRAAPQPRPSHPARAALERLKAQLAEWSLRRRARTALLTLSDAELKDIGISRAQARFEHSRPLWRG